ncbi:MAG: pyridoxamine 5'-phosphate oxidase family protein [Spirochaetales bacterium]|uniref:Pyridoxamine 5'-phosphate oxidase family protein n=1 Tax=Candidatus Thalassospirochaeta sargassi TaxID=3119039 RepID=A0AAJ1IB37_9SPIO|nr:pyridoxamine 5'-phosphate oxidase family protein [Spirochaetales bacterium]
MDNNINLKENGEDTMKMAKEVMSLLNDQEAVKVLTSVSADGIPHSVVVGSAMAPEEGMIAAAEILMQTTSKNLAENSNVTVLAVKGMESYQVTATVKERQTEGPLFENVKAELAKHGMTVRGLWLFEPVEAFNQGAGPDAGKKIS